MSTAIDTQEEARLLTAIKQASDLVDSGLSPNEAVTKVARDTQLTPGRIRAVCCAYNTGQQTTQREENTTALGKFASFPLADAEAVVAELYGTQTKAAVDADYSRPPDWLDRRRPPARVKAASAPVAAPVVPPEPYSELRRQYGAAEREKQAVDELRRRAEALTDLLRVKMASLVSYFEQPPVLRQPFAAVEQGVATYLGANARSLMECVHSQLHSGEKRATDKLKVLAQPLDLQAEPFTTVKECLKLAAAITEARKAAADARHTLTVKNARPEPAPQYVASPIYLLGPDTRGEKEAGLLGTPAVGTALGTFLSRGIGGVPKTKDDLIDDAQLDLEDPAHQNELRKIQAQTMLTSMLTDPDDPISGHSPDKVLSAYNEISRVTPRLAEQPALLRSILQRRLQGGIQPFESKEMIDIEKGLTQTRSINAPREEP